MKGLPCGQCWTWLSLASRLMIVAALAMLLGGATLLYITVRSMADSYHAELAEQLNEGLDSLTIVLGEQAVVGDYATIQQILDGRVKRKNVSLAGWADADGKSLVARGKPISSQAPDWFVEWVDCPHFDGERNLEVGGQSYGKIVMRLTTAPTMNQIWHTFAWQLRIILFGGALFFALSALSLKYGLRPLYKLTQGAALFGQGDYSVRIAPCGAPEILPSIHAFNDMAGRIEGLLDAQRKYTRALEQSANSVVITDVHGDIEYVNPRFCEATGYALEEAIGQNPRILKSGETTPEEYRHLWASITAGGVWRGEFHNRRKDGSLYWESVSIAPIRNEKGTITHFVAVKEDITRRKEAEESLRRLNETLEQRVKEEVAKNREKDHLLIHQSRLAAMGEMIGNIAHQWRQPLNALGLLLSNIQDAYAHHECDQEYLDESVARGQRLIGKMSGTIDDFRNFFKPDREKVRFSLEGAVRDALSVVEASFISSGITVALDIKQDASVMGFPNEYAQVVLNILGNARDAILTRKVQHGRVEIAIGQDKEQAYVSIRDNGGGIANEVMEKIFDPYFTTREKGTGIGLYMSKMIIESNMSGRIEVRNTGDGAEFRIATPPSGNGAGNG